MFAKIGHPSPSLKPGPPLRFTVSLGFSLSVLGKGAEQVAHWLPKSFTGMLFPGGRQARGL